MKVKIRKLKKADFKKGFLESLSNLFKSGLSPEEAQKVYKQVSSNSFYHFFVAELDGKIVGVTTLLVEQKFILKGAKFGYIEDMAVRKGFERRGIGTLLMKAAIKRADKEGCCTVRLDCNKYTLPFYEKNGFSRKRKTIRMQLNLRSISM